VRLERIGKMLVLDDIKKNRDLLNSIDWEMTPEEAVRLYLEWGNNWTGGYNMVRSKDDVTTYFVLNTWENDPVIYLLKRNSEEVVELAKIKVPKELKSSLGVIGLKKGIYPLEGEMLDWLKRELDA
jgi:hypothetical protein